MPNTWFVSDIHGNFYTFQNLCTRLLNLNDHLYILGDCCDRGPHSNRVYKSLFAYIQNGQLNITILMGNHDFNMLDTLFNMGCMFYHPNNGGFTTVESFGGLGETARYIVRNRNMFINFRRYISLGDCILVHAGLNFSNNDLFHATGGPWLGSTRPARKFFLEFRDYVHVVLTGGQVTSLNNRPIIHGHTINPAYSTVTPYPNPVTGHALTVLNNHTAGAPPHHYSIDGGCFGVTGRLVAVKKDTTGYHFHAFARDRQDRPWPEVRPDGNRPRGYGKFCRDLYGRYSKLRPHLHHQPYDNRPALADSSLRVSWDDRLGRGGKCMLCGHKFPWGGIGNRHHCRNCGALVCDACSNQTAPVHGYSQNQRICDGCLQLRNWVRAQST